MGSTCWNKQKYASVRFVEERRCKSLAGTLDYAVRGRIRSWTVLMLYANAVRVDGISSRNEIAVGPKTKELMKGNGSCVVCEWKREIGRAHV